MSSCLVSLSFPFSRFSNYSVLLHFTHLIKFLPGYIYLSISSLLSLVSLFGVPVSNCRLPLQNVLSIATERIQVKKLKNEKNYTEGLAYYTLIALSFSWDLAIVLKYFYFPLITFLSHTLNDFPNLFNYFRISQFPRLNYHQITLNPTILRQKQFL